MSRSNILLNIAGSTNPVSYKEKRKTFCVFRLSYVGMVRSIAPSKRVCTISSRPKALVRHNQRQLIVNQSDHGGCEDVSVFVKNFRSFNKIQTPPCLCAIKLEHFTIFVAISITSFPCCHVLTYD